MQIAFIQEEQYESAVDLLYDMSVHYNGEDAVSRQVIRQHFMTNLTGPDSSIRIVVATCDDGVVVGLIAITIFHSLVNATAGETGQLFVKELYVLRAERRSGVGEALMKWVARYALSKNCVRVDWHVRADNEAGLRFYQSLGGILVDDRLCYRLSGTALTHAAKTDGE
ncbi:GNAT family N-acetyltransferase [Undibacterium sp. CY18W]|uniref:GNAT family N-acetyltransferase n=1 Tax=Undibacterium hunanense TaxID=2762292 RepID=A0ABR6ZYD0_9BURK|nr:GNAT family N-acetyltransferase [Undibacterium hunanense]MBC3920878.1 GNAT family N-acetyltransferase [Undibacterium hunanense]